MSKPRFSAVQWAVLTIALIMSIGGVLSVALTQNPDWMGFHLSRLGEGGHLSSYIFNATSAFSGLAMFELAAQLTRAKGWYKFISDKARLPQLAVALAFRVMGICLVGLAIFPFDKFVTVHNTFGYGMTIVYLLLVAYVTYKVPIFNQWLKVITGLFLALMTGLFAIYFILNGRQITLLQIQALGLGFFFVWLCQLARALK